MAGSTLHRFEHGGKRFVVDTETCFCFECDEISWAVLELYPEVPVNRIAHLVGASHPVQEVEEVIGELEWLRSTQSILPVVASKDQLKRFETESTLQTLDLFVGAPVDPALFSAAMTLLLGRSGAAKSLTLRVHGMDSTPAALSPLLSQAFRGAALAGKSLRVEVHTPVESRGRDGEVVASHRLGVFTVVPPDAVKSTLAAFEKARRKSLGHLGTLPGSGAVLTPGDAAFSDALAYLHQAGFRHIKVDLPGAYSADAGMEPEAVLAAMHAAAVYYAQRLHGGDYYKLEPIASTFHQIYEGVARPRSDDSGTALLAVAPSGDVYPSRHFMDRTAFRLGNVLDGNLDEGHRAAFDDLGALTTSPCGHCWARNLCGGGHSAIHYARGGGIRQPEESWCESQRHWYAAAIAAFNLLSAHGVNFARIHAAMAPSKKASLWQMAKMAVTMKVGVRPIEEADAPLLTRWENWSDAIYFLGNEYGMFLATQYDREMDSLHPRGIEQELVVVTRAGEPMGLLKIRPDARAGLARVWIYFRDPASYGDAGLRRSFSRILTEASSQTPWKTLLACAGPGDPGLGEFLQAIGFQHAGVEREALFLHDAYHDVARYQLTLA